MTPFIQSFTQNLKPCTGCGSSAIDYFAEQTEKGEKVKYTLQVEAEGDDLIEAATSDRTKWKVISGTPQRPAATPQATVTRTATNPFQSTQTVPTPALNG